ncbi:YhbY family RNA-binding protein [Halogeometricum borinquense]|uniref:RNA-binding protein containing kh domain, possibly ribosomal protein n=2 Tax=Halogeometricum borinquense TaxID=60847 RepID=E4NP99_HALBP|nr:YhbY family RNA-binding protein [Halogeometricum borinquense]ADQ67640.1 predicted RNA-binding protein containing KH domain, possibly ribosomal protein [Halogeometricum borinquense DSM 11551]ELY23679.1 RNA-binding protein containing kh domain, possibly ribosomal protein [Halogeometricum borinquense DSM 11551]QIB73769.1 YhbY family RNA-binding protein [Halogeometricum borinquense]QIQ76874.1 YhbY family RNA-binding protein [Halogeometricum borinquense]RYJ13414.1 YhbY family RNA-binding protein
MGKQDLRKEAHDIDVTVWVGKSGISAVEEELSDQLADRDLVKIKFLRSARAGTTVEELTEELADRVNAEVIETRGNTGVVHR